jgi:hypothetical protein
MNGRRGIGIELKPSYYRQAVKNLVDAAAKDWESSECQEEFNFESD